MMSDSNGTPPPPPSVDDAMAVARVEEGSKHPAAATSATTAARTTSGRDDAGFVRQSSVSEAAEASGSGTNAPVWLSWLEWPFHISDPKTSSIQLPEVAGWGMNSAGRGPLNQVGGYVGTAILRLATKAAGCKSVNCNQKIHGFMPSSLLTLTTSIVGVIAAILMPIVGAVVDHTQYRRLMGILSGFLSVVLIGAQMGISESNWFIMLIIDAIQTFVYVVHTTAVFAYLPDLSLDQEVISHYSSRFNMHQYASQFVFVLLIFIAGQVHGTDKSIESTVWTARVGAAIAFSFGVVLIGYCWVFLFRPRPALSRVPPGSTLLTAGFKQVQGTMTVVWQKYRHLRWFMISLLFSPEAGAGVVLSIAVTYRK
jgi:MFS-type transporter involved in bile tolerance (Atg22 family)